jgi:phage gpG-like protein
MKDLKNFKISDLNLSNKIKDKKIETRVNMRFRTNTRVTLEEYDVGIRDLPSDLRKAINKAIDQVIDQIGSKLDDAMEASIWDWPSGSRDIVDTGALKNSRSIQKVGNGFTISYNQPYAAIVHYGGYIQPYGNPKAEKFYYPPRPWVDYVLNGGGGIKRFDFESIFEQALEEVAQKYKT